MDKDEIVEEEKNDAQEERKRREDEIREVYINFEIFSLINLFIPFSQLVLMVQKKRVSSKMNNSLLCSLFFIAICIYMFRMIIRDVFCIQINHLVRTI